MSSREPSPDVFRPFAKAGGRQEPERAKIAVPMTGNSTTRILVAEDDPDIAALLGHYLRKAGFETTVLVSGREVMPELRRELPDLVVLDLMMPGLSGLELCRAIRADASIAAIPIIMLTAKSRRSRSDCRARGRG